MLLNHTTWMSTPRYELEMTFKEFRKKSAAGRELFHLEISSFTDTRRSIAAARSALSMTGQNLEVRNIFELFRLIF